MEVGLKGKNFAAIGADPGNVVTGHSPEVFLHTKLADPEPAGTGPAESIIPSAAYTILFQSFHRIPVLYPAGTHIPGQFHSHVRRSFCF